MSIWLNMAFAAAVGLACLPQRITGEAQPDMCQEGWTISNPPKQKCYKDFGVELSRTEAAMKCYEEGGHLPVIESSTEMVEFLKTVVEKSKSTKRNAPTGFWLAGSDMKKEGEWVWDAIKGPMMYTNWAQGEPSEASDDLDCLSFTESFPGSWFATKCKDKRFVICEHDAGVFALLWQISKKESDKDPESEAKEPKTMVPEYTCPPMWALLKKNCLKYFPESLSWAKAHDTCSSNGGRMALPVTKEENEFIAELIPKQTESIWIDGHSVTNEKEMTRTWMTSIETPIQWSNWHITPIETLMWWEDFCIILFKSMDKQGNRNAVWMEVVCHGEASRQPFVCTKPATIEEQIKDYPEEPVDLKENETEEAVKPTKPQPFYATCYPECDSMQYRGTARLRQQPV